jgi:hypothetical protein
MALRGICSRHKPSDPSRPRLANSCKDEIDAEENPENVEARNWPVRKNNSSTTRGSSKSFGVSEVILRDGRSAASSQDEVQSAGDDFTRGRSNYECRA